MTSMEKQVVSAFFLKLATTLNDKVFNYSSFTDGSCEFYLKNDPANTDLLVSCLHEFFQHPDIKGQLARVCRGESPCYAIVVNDPEVSLATFFVIEGNDEVYRMTIKLLPLEVVLSFSSVAGQGADEDNFGFPYIPDNVTWN